MAWGCTIQICSHTGSYGGLPCLLPSKTKQTNHQVPHLWQKICDGHFTIKSWVIFWHDSYHQCGKLIGKTWLLSEALLHWGLSVGGKIPGLFLSKYNKEWWWYKNQSLSRILKNSDYKLTTMIHSVQHSSVTWHLPRTQILLTLSRIVSIYKQ